MSRGVWHKTEDIVRALQETRGGIWLAAEKVGCSPYTIMRRAQQNPKIRETIDHYRQRRSDVAEMKLEQAILAGEQWAIQFQLRTQAKDRGYYERQETVTKGETLEVVTRVVRRDADHH